MTRYTASEAGKGDDRRSENKAKVEENLDAIFGADRKPQRGSYVYDKELRKMVPKGERQADIAQYAAVHGDIESFVSPVDGTVIDDRAKLRAHNKRHGVTDPRDYGEGWYHQKGKERNEVLNSKSQQNKAQRLDTIMRAMHKHEHNR